MRLSTGAIWFLLILDFAFIATLMSQIQKSFESQLNAHHVTKRQIYESNEPEADYSENPDVIYLIQRSGMSDNDFEFVKKFIGFGSNLLTKLGSNEDASRVGVMTFTSMTRTMTDYRSCCRYGMSYLQHVVMNEFSLYNDTTLRALDRGDHDDLSPHSIDIESAFRALREKYLTHGFGLKKPTLVIFVANFLSQYQSFRLFHQAVDEIKLCKNAGAWVSTIIVDPDPNRQPRIKTDLFNGRTQNRTKRESLSESQKILESRRQFILSKGEGDDIAERNYRQELAEKFSMSDEDLLRSIARTLDSRIEPRRLYRKLSEVYAEAISSRPIDGFHISSYKHLIYPPVTTRIEKLITQPMTWFGEAEVATTCEGTKHVVDRTIWSPGFFTQPNYPGSVQCKWHIKARPGYSLHIKFDSFDTEPTFDQVTIYDGNKEDLRQKIASFSGKLEGNKAPEANSTEEGMVVVFKPDGGHNAKGFHAIWTPVIMFDKIDGAEVVYLVDVSASLENEDFDPVHVWIKLATKFFTFVGESGEGQEEEGGVFGLTSFDEESFIHSSIAAQKTRAEFYEKLEDIKHNKKTTLIGDALDFTRVKQFYLLLGPDGFQQRSPVNEGRSRSIKDENIPKKIIFLFSDAYSIDDPRPAARRLCQANIVPVLISVGNVNIRGQSDITSFCGLSFGIDVPVPEVIGALKVHFKLVKNETGTTTELPPLPTKPDLPNRQKTTTAKPTKYRPIPTTVPPLPQPRKFSYMGLAGLLIAIGFIETVTLSVLMYYTFCVTPTPYHRELDIDEELDEDPVTHQSFAELVKAKNRRRLKSKKARDNKYPRMVNSFFVRHNTNKREMEQKTSLELFGSSDKACCSKKKEKSQDKIKSFMNL